MGRILIWATLLAILAVPVVAGEEYLVAGTIGGIEEEGTLFVALVDEAAWDAGDDPTRITKGYAQGHSYEIDGRNAVEYRFEAVPAGTYAIRAFLDTNANDSLDMGLVGPQEPWGVYEAHGRILGPPRFHKLSFEVEADIQNADFELR